jgi:hypothetical protein
MQTLIKLLALLTPHDCKSAGLLMAFLDRFGVASILPFMAILAKPSWCRLTCFFNAAFTSSSHVKIHIHELFLFVLGVLVFVLLVTSLASKALTNYTQQLAF